MKIRRVYGLDVIAAQIHATQVREWRPSCRSQPTPGQTQVNQKVVVFQVTRLKPTVTSVQVAQLRVPRDGEGPSAGEGVPVAQAAIRAGEVTKTLIVELRTLRPAVTHVCHVQADGGATGSGRNQDTRSCRSPPRPRGLGSRTHRYSGRTQGRQ